MFKNLFKKFAHVDWIMFLSTLPLLAAGLIAMRSLGTGSNYFFTRQLSWIGISFVIFFAFSLADWRFLKNGRILVILWGIALAILSALLVIGKTIKGAASWFNLSSVAFQPSDPIKILIILILAKYFARRHIEIAHIKHIVVSGLYAMIPTLLVFMQPDAGSAIIFFLIWLGMVMVSGINKKHLALLSLIAIMSFGLSWAYVLKPYQKDRIASFLHPLKDIKGSGYNAAQSVIAVGSGGVLGKGIGYGTQSRLEFLPEHQTDFIFAAFAEEWGLIGVTFIFTFFGILIWRILKMALHGQSNFETFFSLGFAIFLMAHFTVHTGMNIGLMPITGVTIPFMSYGGSHMLTVFAGLGILTGMNKYARHSIRQNDLTGEFVSI